MSLAPTLLAVSTVVQCAAALVAIVGLRRLKPRAAWVVVSCALVLMSVRRGVSFYSTLVTGGPLGADLHAEVIALAISILLLVGMILAASTLRRAGALFARERSRRVAARERERLYTGLVASVPVGLAVVREGTILLANDEFGRMLGISRTAALGVDLASFVDPDQRESFATWLSRDDPNGGDDAVRWKFLIGGGGERWCAVHKRAIDWGTARADLVAVTDLSDWQRTTEQLAESESRFRALTESAASAIFIYQGEVMVYANRRAEEISGYPRDELIGMRFWEFIHPEFRELARERGLARLAGLDAPRRYQLKLLRKDGQVRWVDFTAAVAPIQGQPSVIGTAFDVTELRSAEDELRANRAQLEEVVRERTAQLARSEERFRALAENSRDTIMRFDREYRHLYVNPVVESQTGLPCEAFIGKTHAELGFPADLVAIWEDAIERVFVSGEVERIEFQLPTGIWIDWMLIPEVRGDGEVESVITTARDITARKASEDELRRHRDDLEGLVAARTAELAESNEQLRREVVERTLAEEARSESEERFRSLYDNLTIGLYRTTPDGRVLMANPAMVRMLGFESFEELSASDLEAEAGFYTDVPRRYFLDRLEREGALHGMEFSLRRRDGTHIWVREAATVRRDEGGSIMFYEGALEDVTYQKQLEDQLQQSQKLHAVGQLAGGIAHDFNNLLMAIVGSIERLQRRGGFPSSGLGELAAIRKSADRAAELTRNLLAFASRQVLAPRVVALNDIVEDFVPILRRVIPESIAIEFVPGGGLPLVRVDRSQLEQVMMNLCLNSRDAMPGGGTIFISTREVIPDESILVRNAEARREPYVVLTVRDTGEGMDAATLERAFEPFFSTKGAGRGIGMGLASVFGIVRQHNGFVDLVSRRGEGTTCRVFLLATQEERQEAITQTIAAPAPGGSETILVAEDDGEVRDVVVSALEALGYGVIAVSNGVEALDVLARSDATIDLVLTDVIMPGMGGAELFREARTLRPGLRFLFSSGYAESVLDADLVDGVGSFFIGKPYGFEELGRVIRKILEPEPPGE